LRIVRTSDVPRKRELMLTNLAIALPWDQTKVASRAKPGKLIFVMVVRASGCSVRWSDRPRTRRRLGDFFSASGAKGSLLDPIPCPKKARGAPQGEDPRCVSLFQRVERLAGFDGVSRRKLQCEGTLQ